MDMKELVERANRARTAQPCGTPSMWSPSQEILTAPHLTHGHWPPVAIPPNTWKMK